MSSMPLFSFRHLNTPQSMLAKELWGWISKNPGKKLKVLDCGSGSGSMWTTGKLGEFVETNSRFVSVSLLDAASHKTELDPKTFTQLVGILPKALTVIPDDAFDVVLAFDVIEHLDKSGGYLLLYEMDRIGRDCQIIFTPTGFLWQPPSRNNPHNAHISGWRPKELKSLGWKNQTGLMGFKYLMAPYGAQKFSSTSKIATALIGNGMKLSQVLARPFPSLAHSFFATKEIKNPRVLDQEL